MRYPINWEKTEGISPENIVAFCIPQGNGSYSGGVGYMFMNCHILE
jgi:hypothetical protein